MSNFWRRLSTRTTRRLTPLRRMLLARSSNGEVRPDVSSERLAVQPHSRPVVDRLEAQHPLRGACRPWEAEVLAVPVHGPEVARAKTPAFDADGTVVGVHPVRASWRWKRWARPAS